MYVKKMANRPFISEIKNVVFVLQIDRQIILIVIFLFRNRVNAINMEAKPLTELALQFWWKSRRFSIKNATFFDNDNCVDRKRIVTEKSSMHWFVTESKRLTLSEIGTYISPYCFHIVHDK